MAIAITILLSLFVCMAIAAIASFLVMYYRKRSVDAQAQAEQDGIAAREWAAMVQKKAEDHANQLNRGMAELRKRVEPLLKYEQIEDASREADRILREATQRSRETYVAAQDQANTIVEVAKRNNAKLQLQISEQRNFLKAIQNQISGYGDEYLVPSHTLLDDLADEFGHKEAGIEYKQSKATTQWMVKSDKAADCEYADAGRRMNAIHFVLDAFNGKVDSIMSRAKQDNYGKLRQEILDAYHLVNTNGKAFREAKITQEYLGTRITELKWACRVQELKRLEREEQRAIREQIREEEKARRDYEKAIKEAEKEERMLQRAMEEARKQLGMATAAERAKYEEQLADLQNQLSEAEERNQRAISMAQQTKRGHVYVISNVGSFGEDVFKIGLTRRLDPMERVRELGDASVPFSFDVHAIIFSEDAPSLETDLQRRFDFAQVNKVNSRKEFFRTSLKSIRDAVEDKGLDTHWTMTAEAREYRESREIERKERESQQSGSPLDAVEPLHPTSRTSRS